MKKIMAVLIAGTFIIRSVVAQTPVAPAQPSEKKAKMAIAPKQVEKKDVAGTQKPEGKKKHHKGGKVKGKDVKASETKTPEKK